MYLTLCHLSDILDLSTEQLQYIPKVVLLRVYGDYIEHVWHKLLEHVKADEVRTYRRCDETVAASRGGLLNRAINVLPFELHIPGYQFCGPGTRLRAADKVLADKALGRVVARDSALSERAAAAAIWATMKAKTKIGMGMRKKTTRKKATKKRILPTAKRGGALPLLPMLAALGSLIGGAAGVAKAMNDSKAARRQLEELQRHDRSMEQDRGLYLAPYKYGRGLYLGPYKRGQGVAAKKKKTSKRRKKCRLAQLPTCN
ncbi:hypothetical protein ALC57_00368 [Trachymyrmex cornetzi]|uniref:Uncharacterized protein n=1 Tax=Trachymyrmex cornetzi TaxID=471704 RepID=A0A151JS55_9HYME|nr:hypothetical protein ALC57_00368 [Trachymyrmex cornetzi]